MTSVSVMFTSRCCQGQKATNINIDNLTSKLLEEENSVKRNIYLSIYIYILQHITSSVSYITLFVIRTCKNNRSGIMRFSTQDVSNGMFADFISTKPSIHDQDAKNNFQVNSTQSNQNVENINVPDRFQLSMHRIRVKTLHRIVSSILLLDIHKQYPANSWFEFLCKATFQKILTEGSRILETASKYYFVYRQLRYYLPCYT